LVTASLHCIRATQAVVLAVFPRIMTDPVNETVVPPTETQEVPAGNFVVGVPFVVE
jgi:hypothetical protein